MEQFAHINVEQAQALVAESGAIIADIRDDQSYQQSHPQGAIHLTNQSLTALMHDHDPDTPIIVVCYHGHSSQGAAQYLIQQGFEEVYSLDGGFEAWAQQAPVTNK
ncbi:thiosulfate sulfurtransferase GlpE [Celerinatantimonas sp. YJH-8]|uniref:thiosulfate sulfurtransferase GlpE n=1 Tax=Celerinatantimonas sp. YJH-8 TaxID=3228714 RepID=UPI0038C060CA